VWSRPSDTRRYCSKECADNARANLPRELRTCRACGKQFWWRPNKSNRRGTYCSVPCRDKDYQNYFRGERLTFHRGSRDGWGRARRQHIKSGYDFCAVCGSKARLSVHHIIPYRYSMDDGLLNLVTLCHKHHLQLQQLSDKLVRAPREVQEYYKLCLQAELEERCLIFRGRALLEAE